MSTERLRSRDKRTGTQSGSPPVKRAVASGRGRPRLRYAREHAAALALIGLLLLVALPPVLVRPSGEVELIATGVLTLLACVLVVFICGESRRR